MDTLIPFRTSCPSLKYGLKKISMDYYYCKDCDKEEKFPMCHYCLIKCHKGHQHGEKNPMSNNFIVRCSCAMNNHQTSSEESNFSLNTCYFYELNKLSETFYCYQNSHKKQLCDFCYSFCRPNSTEEQEFKLKFKKVEIDSGGIVQCHCPHLPNSKHTAVDFMNKCLGNINKSSDNYFPNTNSVNLINMFFKSDELFRSVNKTFMDVFNQILAQYQEKINVELTGGKVPENYMKIPSVVSRTYLIFGQNALNSQNDSVLFFAKEIKNYFNDKALRIFLGNCEVGARGGKGQYKTEENFYESFLFGYKIFNIWNELFKASLPKYSIGEFINLNPLQRLIVMQRASKCKLEVDYILRSTISLIKSSANYSSVRIILQLFDIIKILASYYLISMEQVNDFLKSIEIFFINFESIKSDNPNLSSLVKLFIKLTQILICFSYFYDDMTFLNNVELFYNTKQKEFQEDVKQEKKEKLNFIYHDSEIARNISKSVIHITKLFEIDYQRLPPLNIKTRKLFHNLMNYIQILINLGFGKQDIYSSGIKRLIHNETKETVEYIINNKLSEKQTNVLKIIDEEEQILSSKFHEYYINSKDIKEILSTFIYSVEKINNILGISNIFSTSVNGSNLIETKNDLGDGSLEVTPIKDNTNNSNVLSNDKKYFKNNQSSQDISDINSVIPKHEKNNSNVKMLDDINFKAIKNFKDKNTTKTNDYVSFNNDSKKIGSSDSFENSNESLKHILDYTNYLFTLSKVFTISNQKDLFPDKFCFQVLSLFENYMFSNPCHILNIFSKQIVFNLADMPKHFLPKIFSLFKKGIKTLLENKTEIGSPFTYLKIIYELFVKKLKYKDDEVLYSICLSKLLQMGISLNQVEHSFKFDYLRFIKEKIFTNSEFLKIIIKYKNYIIDISKDFSANRDFYIQLNDYNNPEIFKKHFNNVQEKIMYKIGLYFIQFITFAYDGNPILSEIDFLKDYFAANEIIQMLEITTLDIKLRIGLIKIFRMIYIDILIDQKKLNLYRTEFQNNIDENLKENLFTQDQNRIFKFYDMLMNVNLPILIKEEYNFLLQEVKLFKDVIKYLKRKNNGEIEKILTIYFENGVILPLVIYLNKVFAVIHSFSGPPVLDIYLLTNYILEMIKEYNENSKNLLEDDEEVNNIGFSSHRKVIGNNATQVRKNITKTFTRYDYKDIIDEDLHLLVQLKFNPLNYYSIYLILAKHIMNIFEHPKTKKLVIYLSDFQVEEENNIANLKNDLKQKGTMLEDESFAGEIFDIYEFYINGKYDYDNNSYKAVFNLNYSGKESTFRTVFSKYLLLMITDDYDIYEEDILTILLNLLISETSQTQSSLIELFSTSNNISNINNSGYNNELTKLNILIEKAFSNMLATILSQFNPALIQFNDNYYTSCALIKLCKFLCEEHNQYFQKYFLKQFYFSLSDIQKIGFYDMILFILEKIIVLSCWGQVKKPEDFHNYFVLLFSCLIELLIEIIQGTEDSNFLSLINQKYEGNQKLMINANRIDPVLRKGKAFDSFLKCVKQIITLDNHTSEELDSIRKLIVDFLLAFMEEYHCPMEIKMMIIINFHASSIIKSISTVLKKIYLNRKGNTIEKKLKTRRTLILIDSQFNAKKGNEKEEMGKIFFNNEKYKEFLNLYYTDNEFSESPSFQLCCSFYKYFKLTLMQCQDRETQSFWKKIHSIKKYALNNFDELSEVGKFISEGSDFEAYYVIKLFEQILNNVLVKVNEDKPPIYVVFIKPPCLNYLSQQTKDNFLQNVNRRSRNTKLIELMTQTEYFKIEAEHNFDKLRNHPFIKKISWMNYYYFCLFIYIIDLALNIFMLCVDHESGKEFDRDVHYYQIIRGISIFFCLFVIGIILIWWFTKNSLDKSIETAKYLQLHKKKEKLNYYDHFIILYNSFLSKRELKALFIFLIFKILGSIRMRLAFCYSFSLCAIIYLSDNISVLLNALFMKGRQLLWVIIFTIVTCYFYGGWGFYYLNDNFYDDNNREVPENMCETLLYCFLTLINNGLRWYPGVGKVLRVDSALKHLKHYIHNYLYHFSFYLIIRVIMLKIVFGIILDSFSELREVKRTIELDMKYKCFICNIEKDECDKQSQDFHDHCEIMHNIWNYANYMIMLRMTDSQNLNGINSMCKDMIIQRQMKWIPDGKKDGAGTVFK